MQAEAVLLGKEAVNILQNPQSSANLPTKWEFEPVTSRDILVGAETTLEALQQSLMLPSGSGAPPGFPEVVCLHGMGGVGKTTLAKQIHDSDEVRSQFNDKMMYVVCGEARTGRNMIDKVYQVWMRKRGSKSALGQTQVAEAEESKCGHLVQEMKGERFLMVIDDVWQSDQIDWIREVCPENCSVIVTTRNREVVQIPGTEYFLVEPLREGESFRLFCHFAFGRQVPPPDLEDVARRVCKQCDGLPLALKVVASSICPRNQDSRLWDRWLEFLKGAHPAQSRPGAVADFDTKVIKTLQRSIEALAEIDSSGCVMDMFLDLAGFPEDERVSRDLVEAQWSIYPFGGDSGLETARERLNAMVSLSLVETHGDSYVSLHDMIRKAALDMINSASAPTVALGRMSGGGGGSVECADGFRQRLFLQDHCPSIEEAAIHESTRKFMSSTSSGSPETNIPDLSLKMPHLVSFYWSWRREVLFFVDKVGQDAHLSHEEKSVMRGRDFLQQVTSSSTLQIMTLLNFPKPSVLPHDYFLSFLNLRVLWVEFFGTSSDEKFPGSIRHLQRLEVLVIDFSCNAAAFRAELSISPLAIAELHQLRVLRMSGVTFPLLWNDNRVLLFLLSSPCLHLQDFSISLFNKISKPIVPFPFSDHSYPDIPSTIGNWTRLRSIKLEGWRQLRSLPVTIGLLSSLTRLEILSSRLESIPDKIGDLQSLIHLSIKSATLWGVPPAVGRLSRLTSLDLSDSLPNSKSIPEAFWGLTQLRQLTLAASVLRYLPEKIGNLTELRELDLNSSLFQSLPSSIGNLCMLTRLDLSSSISLRDLGMGISGLSSLRCLSLEKCMSLTFLSDGICKLGNLTRLNLSDCSRLASLPDDMGSLSQLRVLNLQNAYELESLPDSVSNLSCLMELNLSYCTHLTRLPTGISDLKELKLDDCLLRLLRLQDRPELLQGWVVPQDLPEWLQKMSMPMESTEKYSAGTSDPHESEFLGLEVYDNRLKAYRCAQSFRTLWLMASYLLEKANAGDVVATLHLLYIWSELGHIIPLPEGFRRRQVAWCIDRIPAEVSEQTLFRDLKRKHKFLWPQERPGALLRSALRRMFRHMGSG
ncbi:hypothetical protein CBR_g37018 [Chara braunii]|uniref:Uncharacterized protein n=1 Tax=Chara braunii TaxID=69332 RepID=A0A388LLU7_CHABU|nr:hypothetical protein CBR_g37018 [Chara braunii]|eukprot:GBG83306.1 hypothetical protein CBR_g37018 [Chara braunii]